MSNVVESIFGGGEPDTPPPPPEAEPDWAGMWGNYSRMRGEAEERYTADAQRIARQIGLGVTERREALDAREVQFARELEDLESGPTYQQLSRNFQEAGGEGDMETFYRSRYGGYESGSAPTDRIAAANKLKPREPGSGVGTEADIAGLGGRRAPWYQA